MKRPLRIDGSQREDDDPTLYTRLTRDVCFLYHQLSQYRYIMGDLDYATDYPLAYWSLLNRVETPLRDDDRFIRGGIMILMLAMLDAEFDGAVCWISRHLEAAIKEINAFIPEDSDMLRLSSLVGHGLAILSQRSTPDKHFEAEMSWAYEAFVRAYFIEASR